MNAVSLILTTLASSGVLLALFNLWRSRRKDALDLENAREQSPYIRESLLLGNVEHSLLIQEGIIKAMQSEIDRANTKVSTLERQVDERDRRIIEMADKIRLLLQEVTELHERYADGQLRLREVEATLRSMQDDPQ